jgi:ATP-binding cassette subfamily F protein 2
MAKKDRAAEKRKAAKAEAEAAANGSSKAPQLRDGGRLTSEELGFQIRTGPDAVRNRTRNLDIEVNDVCMYAGGTELLYNTTLKLVHGVNYGLIGRNGVGKSTLLRHIAAKQIAIPEFVFTMHVEQEIEGDDTSVIDAVVKSDKEREYLLELESRILALDPEEHPEQEADGIGLMEIYERLEELDSDNAETRAAMILSGLGFEHENQLRATKEFSGGWRMRIALAQALFMNPDLLLLDEPTNHLDVPALTWLTEFLNAWEKTILIVSHDKCFLNSVTNATAWLHRKKLWYYGGNYDTYVRVLAEHRTNQNTVATQQQRKVEALKDFIARFGHGHKKMAKQAQSRMKLLKKIEEEAVDVDFDDPYMKLEFPSCPPLPPPCISVINASFGYDDTRILYKDLNFGVDCESRVCLVGPNGAGKSTFLKLLGGDLMAVDGSVSRHSKLVIARFTQHHVETLDLEIDSVTQMQRIAKGEEMPIEEARRYLGRFGLGGDLALQKVKTLSGGQKSRLAFAMLAYHHPHIILFDEPTNHLDLETIEALIMAINKFEGGVVLVSHDERLVSLVADELWIVSPGHKEENGEWIPGSVTVFDGSFDDYKKILKDDFLRKKLLKGGGRIRTAASVGG